MVPQWKKCFLVLELVMEVLILIGSGDARRGRSDLRIYKGATDSGNEFPFIVMLNFKIAPFMRQCTGSLIAKNWVLTAAHCFEDGFELIVRYGDFTSPPNETKLYSNIIKTFKPATFNIITIPKDDIALALIEQIATKPFAKLLTLDYRTLYGLPVKYAGFGRVKFDLAMPPAEIELKKLVFVPLQVGDGIVSFCPKTGVFIGTIICIAAKCSNRKQGVRSGDSGGPLTRDGRVVGVAKAGLAYGNLATSGSFTPVSIYLDWIKHVIRKHSDHLRLKLTN